MKKFSIFLCVGMLLLASGCGSSYEDYGKSVLQISKKDSVTELIYDTFDEEYYIGDELESSVKEEVLAYNTIAGEDLVELKKCKVRDQKVTVMMQYDSTKDYADFNHIGLFHGKIEEFVASEYHGYVDLKDKDGEAIPLSSVVASGGKYNVIALDMDCVIEIKGKIKYVSEGVELISDNTADVTMNDTAYAYIIYK